MKGSSFVLTPLWSPPLGSGLPWALQVFNHQLVYLSTELGEKRKKTLLHMVSKTHWKRREHLCFSKSKLSKSHTFCFSKIPWKEDTLFAFSKIHRKEDKLFELLSWSDSILLCVSKSNSGFLAFFWKFWVGLQAWIFLLLLFLGYPFLEGFCWNSFGCEKKIWSWTFKEKIFSFFFLHANFFCSEILRSLQFWDALRLFLLLVTCAGFWS